MSNKRHSLRKERRLSAPRFWKKQKRLKYLAKKQQEDAQRKVPKLAKPELKKGVVCHDKVWVAVYGPNSLPEQS